MQSIASVEINLPIDAVFELTTEHVVEWSQIVVDDEVLESTPDRVGTRFRTVTQDRGQKMEFLGVVTAHEPPNFNAVHLEGELFDIDAEYTFESLAGNRTKVTQVSNVTGKKMMKLVFLLLGWVMSKASCDAAQKEMNHLKRYCEEGYQAPPRS